ncbi:MAG: signal peptidase I [Candidatus Eisenbacteria bacterium]|nr:signal peptidase I [Candidatus Eisenbacteria bacterium]
MRENVESLAWAVVLMLIVRIFAIQAFRIPSESMLQTLQVGDFLFISKYEYGAKIPFTHIRLPGIRQPRTGDIIVFQFPMDPSIDFIKRCIATGGQTVEIRHRQVFVDGKPLDEPYVQHIEPTELPAATSPRDNLAPFTVPPGQLFMMGDNRENSEDGRFWGFVPMDYVKGRALFLYFSTAAQNWYTMPFHIRWNRLFRPIH